MRKLAVFLTDPLKVYHRKGEIKDRYYNPKDFFDEVHIISFCGEEVEKDRVSVVAGGAKLFIYAVGRPNAFAFFGILRKICALLESIRPDVLRAYDPSLRGAIAVWCGRKFGIPSVVSVHTEPDAQRRFDKRPLLRIRKIFESYTLHNADCIICVSNYVAEYARRRGAGRIEVLHNSVRLKNFQDRPFAKLFKRKTVFSVGRFEEPKRQDCLIEAMSGLDMDLALAGDGKLRKALEGLAEEAGSRTRVLFIGSIPNEEIYKYYLSCDIFAIATDFEGFCIPVIEAMAAGKPVVASDIPAIRELIGDAGLLVNNDARSFRDAFASLAADPKRCAAMTAKGRERAKMFDASILEEREKAIYGSVCRV